MWGLLEESSERLPWKGHLGRFPGVYRGGSFGRSPCGPMEGHFAGSLGESPGGPLGRPMRGCP